MGGKDRESCTRALGVLAGRDMSVGTLRPWLQSADFVLAADAGVDLAIAGGRLPDHLIGDLDSASEYSQSIVTSIHQMSDQDSTDADKLLRFSENAGLEALTLICVEGNRPDHALATLQSAAKSTLKVRLAYRGGIGAILHGPVETSPCLPPGNRLVSLLPLTRCERVTLSGVRWPLADRNLEPLGFTSISNQISDPANFRISIESGAALLFIELQENETPYWESLH